MDKESQIEVIPPTPPTKRRIPILGIYAATIVPLVLLAIIFVPRIFTLHKSIETRFLEALVEVKGNHGDVLETATYKNNELFSDSDKLNFGVLGFSIPLGTTEASVMVPVTYRFHVLLSDHWQIRSTRETVTIIAPELHPSIPPAPDISKMEVKSKSGWARFDAKDKEQSVISTVTNTLNARAVSLGRSQLIRDASRKSVEGFLKNWIRWLPEEAKNKVFVIKFGNEAASQ